MLLSKAISVRNGMESRHLSWEETAKRYRSLFLGGEELDAGRQTAERLSPIAGAHRILTNSFAAIPFGVYRKDGDARVSVDDEALKQVLKVRPCPMMSPFVCAKIWMSNAFWHGWGAIWNRRDGTGVIVERVPLPTECATIRRDSDTGLYWYDFHVDGVLRTFSSYELSLLFFESYDGVRGRGMLALAREAIAADGMAQRYGKKFYQNGARLSGIVEVAADTNPESRRKIKEQFMGYAKDDMFKVAVLDHDMKFTPMGLSQTDAQFVESRSFTVEEVARFTGVPKYMLQTGKESYNSNQQQRVDFVTDTLMPYIIQREQEGTYKELTRRQREAGWYIHGNPSVLLRGDDMTRGRFYDLMIRNSVYNPDECRAMEERPPIPGGLGSRFMMTKNYASLEEVLGGDT